MTASVISQFKVGIGVVVVCVSHSSLRTERVGENFSPYKIS